MLYPIYRKYGVELTRYFPWESKLAGIPSNRLEARLIRFLRNDDLLERLTNVFNAMDRDVYDVEANFFGEILKAIENVSESERGERALQLLYRALNRYLKEEDLEDDRRCSQESKVFNLVAAIEETRAKWRLIDYRVGMIGLNQRYPDLIYDAGFDPYCVEVSSAPSMTWTTLQTFYEGVTSLLSKLGYLAHSDYVTGAAGHVHVELTLPEAVKVLRIMLDHPWAMMAFMDPRDSQAPLLNSDNYKQTFFSIPMYLYRTPGVTIDFPVLRYFSPLAWRPRYGTLEYRLFDVAQTWEMQEEHVAFAQAFTEWALKQPFNRKPMSRSQVEALTVKACRAGFKDLIKKLGLPWSRYRWYADINLAYRFDLKTPNFIGDYHASYYVKHMVIRQDEATKSECSVNAEQRLQVSTVSGNNVTYSIRSVDHSANGFISN